MEKTKDYMKNQLNLNIQGLKGIAAIVVFLSHALNMYKISWVQNFMDTPMHLFFDGQCSVIIFLTISGFFYYKAGISKALDFHYLEGLKKKIIRIYPQYIICIIVGAVLCNFLCFCSYSKDLFTSWSSTFWTQPISIIQLISQMPIFVGLNPDLIDPPVWYLLYEVRAFFIIPIVVIVVNKCTIWGGKLLIIALFCIFTMIIQPFYTVIFIGLLGRILLEECNIKLLMSKNWEKGILVLFSLLLLNIKNLSLNLQNNIELVIQAFGAVIIVILSFKNNFCFLSWKCLVNMGNISYEFYLVHFIILLSFRYVGMNSYIYIVLTFVTSLVGAVILKRLAKTLICRKK
mgnify:FL=1